ncbi:glycosyltransferase family 4 protein [Microbacterium esteraromaticum]|uniref:glycosyltransferase family 4 protein n=1 Tax=Microbacterium esteraromaticum TaxID=57043 RepID=UPI001CD61E73|nr:glycosyltransferase family 1 protein [Microbacterium esteraromaticum]MCA1305499.1 glycosyltransferase family 4 protein [Microbacterium esteraromaticum]
MIAINCRFLTQDLTGVQRFAEEITTHLAQSRDDVRLVAPPGELRHSTLGGRVVEQIGSTTGHRWEQWDLPRLLRRDLGAPLLLSLMNTGPVLYRPQIVTHHDVTYVRHPRTYALGFRLSYRLLSAMTLTRANRIITVSEFSRQEIAAAYRLNPRRISVVPNAAGAEFARTHQEATPPYLLAVASFLPHKNIDRLVHAFETYRARSGTSTVLKLVGSARPAAMAGTNGSPRSADGVEMLGRVDDSRLQDLYAGARGFVFPSLYEGFGVPPLEAQSAGSPVAASDIPPAREVLGHSALFFPPDDEESMIRALATLDTSRTERDRLRDLGFANAARYSWGESTRLVSALLDDAVHAGRHAPATAEVIE